MKKFISLFMFIALLFLATNLLAQDETSNLPTLKGAKALINGINKGELTINEIIGSEITIDLQGYTVIRFTVTLPIDGDLYQLPADGNKLSERQATLVRKRAAGDKIYIEYIILQNASGEKFTVPAISLQIKN